MQATILEQVWWLDIFNIRKSEGIAMSQNKHIKLALILSKIYLEKALPEAMEEERKGNLNLNKYISLCKTKGCVMFYFFEHAKKYFPDYKNQDYDKINYFTLMENDILGKIFPRSYFDQLIDLFGGKDFSLEERKEAIEKHIAILETK